jgi:RNA polymerase sigma-70 factor (ECF subfamily)
MRRSNGHHTVSDCWARDAALASGRVIGGAIRGRTDLTAGPKTCLMKRMRQSVEATGDSDAIAIERTLAGDRDAFRVLVERHSRNVFRLAYRMTGNQHDAEEVVQEAFLRAYQKLGQFAARANFGTWVYRIAANYAIDRMRQRKNEDAQREPAGRPSDDGVEGDVASLVPDRAPSPERLAQSEQLAVRMRRALNELTPAERTAFVMRHWGGSGIEEIAEALKSSTSAAKNTVFRSVQKLRRSLEPFVERHGQAKAMGTEL